MKKLFVLIFTLTLSASVFSWGGGITCDEFLDGRKSNNEKLSLAIELTNKAAFDWFVFGHMEALPNITKLLNPLIMENPPVTHNQMLYLIEEECRNAPTQSVAVAAISVYRKIVNDALKKK